MSYGKTMAEIRAELRKNNKPMMEKRRRARINVCLSQLQSLVLDAMKKDTPRYSKLEKADILEMTVKHLRLIQRNHMTAAVNYDPSIVTKYRAGFNECATEVVNYLSQTDGISPQIRTRLLNHLSKCLHTTDTACTDAVEPVHKHTATSSSSRQRQTCIAVESARKEITTQIGAAQLIPGCLPNGQLPFFIGPNSESSRARHPCSLAQPLNLSSKQELELKLEVRDDHVVDPNNEIVKVPEKIWRPW